MPQKQKAKRIFFAKPAASPDGNRTQTLLFQNAVKKFATDKDE